MPKDETTIKISRDDHRWLANKSDETQITIKSIVNLAVKSLRGEPETNLMALFRDTKKGRK